MASLTLFNEESLDFIQLRLQALDWQIKIATSENDRDLFATDAFLTTDVTVCSRIQQLSNQHAIPSDEQPLCVLITDNFNASDAEIADIILPPDPDYIVLQLQKFLELHTQIRDLKRSNQQLHYQAQLQKRASDEVEIIKNAIVRNVSHELKTPLLQVKSAVSLMSEDHENQDLVDYAQNATARLETMVKNITLLGSSLDINPSPVILRDAIEYAKRNVRRAWEHRNAVNRIQIEISDHLPPVKADKHGLSTVLQLLVDNALKFSDEYVYIKAYQHNEEFVCIAVQDHGIGIDKSEQQAIFKTFYQIDHSSTRRYGGMGVGLAIVRLILDRHNTQIKLESKINEGSTFSFMLPSVPI